MRTTVTLEADTAALLRRHMRERGVTFKQAVNDAIRAGLSGRPSPDVTPFRTKTADLGLPGVNLDRALEVAGDIEDEELLRKHRAGK